MGLGPSFQGGLGALPPSFNVAEANPPKEDPSERPSFAEGKRASSEVQSSL